MSEARQLPGVLAVITGDECPHAVFGQQLQAYRTAAGRGQGRLLRRRASPPSPPWTRRRPRRALDLIEVEYEELPVYSTRATPCAGMTCASTTGPRTISNYEGKQQFGDVDDTLEKSHVVVENGFYSSYTHCGFLEPQSTVADYNPGTGQLTVYTCNQLPHYLQQTIARTIDLPDGEDPGGHPDGGRGLRRQDRGDAVVPRGVPAEPQAGPAREDHLHRRGGVSAEQGPPSLSHEDEDGLRRRRGTSRPSTSTACWTAALTAAGVSW